MNKKWILIGAIVLLIAGITTAAITFTFEDIKTICPTCVKTISKPVPQTVDMNWAFLFADANENFIAPIDARYFADNTEQKKEIKRLLKILVKEHEKSFEEGTEYALCLEDISDARFTKFIGYCYDFVNKEWVAIT